jgi:hypothetical protein
MKIIKSNRTETEELVELIKQKTKYKVKIANWLNSYLVNGITITIKQNSFNSIDFVYYNGELSFYTNLKPEQFPEFTKQVIKDLEDLTNKDILIIY